MSAQDEPTEEDIGDEDMGIEAFPTSNQRAAKITHDIHKLLRFHGWVFHAPAIQGLIAAELRIYAADVSLAREQCREGGKKSGGEGADR